MIFNKRKVLLTALASTFLFVAHAQKNPQLGKASVDEVVGFMTLEEKIRLLIGTGMSGFSGETAVVGETKQLVPGAAGTTYAFPR